MVLVTGASGLVGSYLAKLLIAKGEKVRAIKRTTSDLSLLGESAGQIEWVEGDVLDISSLETAMKDIKKLYHCAAVISFLPSERDHMMKVNIEGVANVMNTALNSGVEKVAHVSSIAALGVAPPGKVMDENYSDPNINKSFSYHRSKHYGEREVWRASNEGLNVVIANPSTILGAGWWDDEPNSLFREIYNGLKFYTTAMNAFVDVRDVAECLYRLMESDITGERFIVSAENISFREMIWMMADSMKVKRPPLQAHRLLLSIAWRTEVLKSLFSNKRLLITRESARLATIDFDLSNEKIKQALNYSFKPVKDTVAETGQVFLKSWKEGKEYGVF